MAKRQIVFIMTDSQRKDMVGCYGNPAMRTPCLDRLAGQGIRFERAYCAQPVCGPGRSAIFTGTYPHSNGSWGNSMPLGDNVKTVGQRLRDSDIRSAYIGKWHLDGGDYFGLGRCPDGWDPGYWYDMRNYLEELSEEDRRRSRRTETNRDGVAADFTFGHRCSDRAIDFLQNHADDDFLLAVSYDEPHGPFLCPREYWEPFADYEFPRSANLRDNLEDKPAHQRAWAGDRRHQDPENLQIKRPYYFGCNSFVDYEIGRVLDAVDRRVPEALVVYLSDHGDLLHSHGLAGKGAAMYDEITNTPFIVRWPDRVPAGVVCHHPVSHIDVVPTLLEAMDLPLPKILEGASLLPTLQDSQVRPSEAIFMEFTRYEIDHDGFGGFQPIRGLEMVEATRKKG